jgi:RNase adaptor protein for sRNA GlmZ degradation
LPVVLSRRWKDNTVARLSDATSLANMSAPAARVISFGFRHEAPPAADVLVDIQPWLRDPAAVAWCLPLTGRDDRVRRHVLAAPGAAELLAHLEGAARTLLRLAAGARPVVVAVGCAGGRHRSVALAEELADRLRSGWLVAVEHRHVDWPLLSPAHQGNAQPLPETRPDRI